MPGPWCLSIIFGHETHLWRMNEAISYTSRHLRVQTASNANKLLAELFNAENKATPVWNPGQIANLLSCVRKQDFSKRLRAKGISKAFNSCLGIRFSYVISYEALLWQRKSLLQHSTLETKEHAIKNENIWSEPVQTIHCFPKNMCSVRSTLMEEHLEWTNSPKE